MVHRAQRPGISVSAATSPPTHHRLHSTRWGFNHFFRGPDHPGGGDQVFFQGHASPGVYARAFVEGRLTETQMDGFRQEVSHPGGGLPSYPHPRLMPWFWQFPTVSMGLGPLNAIYQARFNKYLTHRGIRDASDQNVYAFLGDGETDEVDAVGALTLAAREELDNLTFVVNCNLQRLDGPVRGNGKIIQELESLFRGAGWNVIKVVWGRKWDELLARDRDGALVSLMNNTPDGDFQTYKSEDGAFVREHFFGRDPRTARLVEGWSDDEIWSLQRGGHDYRKMHAAYEAASRVKGQPTVILAKTIKGWTLGSHFEGRNSTHQMKKLTLEDLKAFRDTLRIPVSDAQLEENPYLPPYFHPGAQDEAIEYMLETRRRLGGSVPTRRTSAKPLKLPGDDVYTVVKRGSGKQAVATTMAFVRLLKDLMKDPEIGDRFVPIIPDEARTFGMDSLFPTAKIYSPHGQQYLSVDRELMLSYKESQTGQILHEGINEAGSVASFTAVGSSYSTQGESMIPVYVFYSMFGFQRTGDGFWAADGPDGPRLRARSHGRADDPQRRGAPARGRPLAAPREHQPRRRGVRPGVRLRDRPHRQGRPATHVRGRSREHLLLPDHLQRAVPAAGGAGRRRCRRDPARHAPGERGCRRRAQGAAARERRRSAVGAAGAGAAPR
jgi:pyruvate dehydrogenase E1 component